MRQALLLVGCTACWPCQETRPTEKGRGRSLHPIRCQERPQGGLNSSLFGPATVRTRREHPRQAGSSSSRSFAKQNGHKF